MTTRTQLGTGQLLWKRWERQTDSYGAVCLQPAGLPDRAPGLVPGGRLGDRIVDAETALKAITELHAQGYPVYRLVSEFRDYGTCPSRLTRMLDKLPTCSRIINGNVLTPLYELLEFLADHEDYYLPESSTPICGFNGKGRIPKDMRMHLRRRAQNYVEPAFHDVRLNRTVSHRFGTLVARILETRQSPHLGDAAHGVSPVTPEPGQEIILGTGTVWFPDEEDSPDDQVALIPADERPFLRMDLGALYSCHYQTVALYFEAAPGYHPLPQELAMQPSPLFEACRAARQSGHSSN